MTKKKVNKSKKVVKSTASKTSIWKKVGAVIGIGLVTFAGAGLGVKTFAEPTTVNTETIDTSEFATKADLTETNNALVEVSDLVKSTNEKVVEEDIWEATAEVLALDELENRDYRDLRKELVDEDSSIYDNGLDDVDYDEIEDFEVTVKDVTYPHMDVDDKDATVVFELKVEYENDDGDNVNNYVNNYVTATASIEDGEVEDLVFTNIA